MPITKFCGSRLMAKRKIAQLRKRHPDKKYELQYPMFALDNSKMCVVEKTKFRWW